MSLRSRLLVARGVPCPCKRSMARSVAHLGSARASIPNLERASAGAMPTAGRSCRRSAMMFRALVHCAVVATIRKGNSLALATRENREGLLHESHRRSRWLLSNTEAPPVPFRCVLSSLLAVPSLACSVASLSLCPGGYLPDQHSLQSAGLAGCQIA